MASLAQSKRPHTSPLPRCPSCGGLLDDDEAAGQECGACVLAAYDVALARDTPQLSTAAPLPEAPASVNCHITVAGRQVQLTLRDAQEDRLLARLEAVLSRYPLPQGEGLPAAKSPQQPPSQDQPAPQPDGWCLLHGVQMTWHPANDQGGGWYSHKADEEWCRGKVARGRR